VGDLGGSMANILNFEKDFSNNSNKAQDLVWDAWDAKTKAKAEALANKALLIDPDCCDAFNVLAWTAINPAKETEYYKKAIDAFKKRHTDEYFNENKGYFWGELETRPFMRALQGYGRNLYDHGQKEEAEETYSYSVDEAVVYMTDEFGLELWHAYPDALKALASLGITV
jgi:hypothetical protein